ncbi:MAG: RluA family pseudouridine synthase [Buchnera aphidicola (Periphyllus lyropictus)]|uniref:RluA family pseudouridine synthase n=1 Tax=Buchnera aphidicola TaxID=9 RepID=UPI001EBBCEC5|nr:RluA family pseudouridine synthase [Buchnera aphidicola]NIH16596.1 RluA family pseudouridine synthase [Buchnera aphidicola (Periphyllus lyropictus)]USS94486.1 RluA family pseudouridine synthase [Buchnera aphidicola (Periphyllus lyropictus)]
MNNIITKVSFIIIKKFSIKQRIDNFLINKFKNVPKSKLYNIIRKGRIRINKKRVKARYKLKIGDKIRIPPLKINYIKKKKISINTYLKKKILKNILYEDNLLMILNKPSGLSVHGGSGIDFGIIEILRILKPKNKYLELIHRLDRYTSGILMIAKKKSSLRYFHEQFRNKLIKKTYISLVHGNFLLKKKIVNNSLLKNNNVYKKKMVYINDQGKSSKTLFKIKKNTILYSFLKIIPFTGRTHQIRVHSAYLGHPIIFDNRYGNNFLDKKIKEKKIKKTLFLHARKIIFFHPKLKKKIIIKAPIKKNFKNAIKYLF